MGLLDWLRGPSDEQIVENYLRTTECDGEYTSGAIRHYMIEEVTDDIERKTGIALRDDQTAKVVQRIRDDYGYGPIAEHNMPGYANSDDYPDYPEEYAELVVQNAEREERNTRIAEEQGQSGGGFLGWLLGR
jgi:hypothetical protein